MDLQRLQRYLSVERWILFIIVIIVTSLNAKANVEIISTENGENLIQEVTYDYSLYTDNSGKLKCTGTLSLLLTVPEDATEIIFFCTNPLQIIPDHIRAYTWIVPYSKDTKQIIRENFRYNTYFKIAIWYPDDKREYTKEYCINDYISRDDLALLQESSSVHDLADLPKVELLDNSLSVCAPSPLTISIFDIYGRQILSDVVTGCRMIPLDNFSSEILIVKYSNSNEEITKKLIIP